MIIVRNILPLNFYDDDEELSKKTQVAVPDDKILPLN